MRKLILFAATIFICSSANAFSFKEMFNKDNVESAVTAIAGERKLSPATLAGTWTYKKSAVKLESSKSALTEVAGSVATSQVEEKLDGALAKVGITPGLMTFTFTTESTFTCKLKNRNLQGTYTIDSDSKITLQFTTSGKANIGKVSAHAELAITTLSLLFEADKLLKIVDAVSSATGNTTLATFNTLMKNYDGVMVGFDLTK